MKSCVSQIWIWNEIFLYPIVYFVYIIYALAPDP